VSISAMTRSVVMTMLSPFCAGAVGAPIAGLGDAAALGGLGAGGCSACAGGFG